MALDRSPELEVMHVPLTVGEVARLSGVTVRTLHHYDAIGLLRPSGRDAKGYRCYDDDDLDRLQRILFYRELELPLDEIQALLDGHKDILDHLRRQHHLLIERRHRLDQLITTLEHTMNAKKLGINLTPEEMLEVFGDTSPGEDLDEAERRWGDTSWWRQSREHASAYTKQDWLRFRGENDDLVRRTITAFDAGEPAQGGHAMDLAEEGRQLIDRWFYDCSPRQHRDLGNLYVDDPRYTASYDHYRPGLARWLRTAIHANADRQQHATGHLSAHAGHQTRGVRVGAQTLTVPAQRAPGGPLA
jgi:DNA-binding transcriptional MerR regulator